MHLSEESDSDTSSYCSSASSEHEEDNAVSQSSTEFISELDEKQVRQSCLFLQLTLPLNIAVGAVHK